MPVPNSFANVTTSIPLSQLDANFATPITLGNTAIQLGNTVTTLNNMTLANVTISSGNVTITNVTVTTANVTTANITTAVIGTANVTTANATTATITTGIIATANVTTANIATEIVTTSQTLSYGTANGVVYLNASKVSTSGANLVFDGTNLGVGTSSPSVKLDVVNASGRAARIGGFQFGGTTSSVDGGNNLLSSGAYWNGSNFTATQTTSATVQLGNGAINFYTESGLTPSGTYSGTVRATIDSSGNVGIGTTSPAGILDVVSSGSGVVRMRSSTGSGTVGFQAQNSDTGTTTLDGFFVGMDGSEQGYVYNYENAPVIFGTNSTERARIDSSGTLLVGTTSKGGTETLALIGGPCFNMAHASTGTIGVFRTAGISGSVVGSITITGSTTSYNTSSDYRLKDNIAPMTGALAKIAALKPCTYKWKADGSDGEGFIAHELAEVAPQCVSGEKDAVETYTDDEGNEQTRPVYQGIDTSFLVATLTAAIQEQQQMIETLQAKVAALEAK